MVVQVEDPMENDTIFAFFAHSFISLLLRGNRVNRCVLNELYI